MSVEQQALSGVAGFRSLHNYGEQVERRRVYLRGLVVACVTRHLRRKAYLAAGGKESDAACPRGFFYDHEGPGLAHMTATDWREFREEYSHIQLSVTVMADGRKKGDYTAWVDPDDVEGYRAALNE